MDSLSLSIIFFYSKIRLIKYQGLYGRVLNGSTFSGIEKDFIFLSEGCAPFTSKNKIDIQIYNLFIFSVPGMFE